MMISAKGHRVWNGWSDEGRIEYTIDSPEQMAGICKGLQVDHRSCS